MAMYDIQIYNQDTPNLPICSLEASEPFLSLHVGDFIDAATRNSRMDAQIGMELRIIKIKHLISTRPNGDVLHRMYVYVLPSA